MVMVSMVIRKVVTTVEGEGHYASNCTVKPRKWDAAYLQQQLQIAQEEEAGIQSTQEECEFMAAADAYEETKRVKVNCTLEDTLQQASLCWTQSTMLSSRCQMGRTERLQMRSWRFLRVKSCDTQCASNTLDPLFQKLEDEKVSLESQWTQAPTYSIIRLLQKQLYDTIYDNAKLKSPVIDKVLNEKGTTKVTSNSAPSTRESKGVQTVKVIASRIFRTNHSKTSRVDNVVPNKPVKSSGRTKPITASQPNVIHRQQANSNSSGFSPTRVNNTAKTISPQAARVHSKSKSSCLSNNFEKLEENHRNSLIPKTQKHKSSECNNIKLAVRNAKSEVVCAMCKQCFVTGNHDVCMLNYVNDMNSRADNQSANVSKLENQKKHKANVRKSKELGSQGSLASSRPSKRRNCLRWVPMEHYFDMLWKLTHPVTPRIKSDKSVWDNAK
ncbi:hypothetical protein Tco_1111923 [Tanacetum coccineum]|uniref:Uncharacterized protein n=1 Tax=Tanacetum coccineum TaxID=301880 RepID=A0ABQ5IPE5_9ASTR